MKLWIDTISTKFTILFKAIYFITYSIFFFYTKSFDQYLLSAAKNKKANWTENKTKIGCRYINKLLRVFNIKSCLVKSVAYKAFLNNVGWEAKLYIAVNNKKDFYSHSWVESTIETIGKPSSSMKIIRIVE